MDKAVVALSKKEKILRTVLWGALEVFALVSLTVCAVDKNIMKVLMCILTILLVSLPFIAIKLFHFEMNPIFFVFCELYAIGPMLGHVFNLYYHTTWWDDLLHTTGGVVFAIFGVYLAKFISKNNEPSLLMKAIFALCFSMAVSVAWEFIEYGCDCLFGTDMQNDTIVSYIHSYLLGEEMAQTGNIDGITDVLINGQPLGVNGYLDIGLHDTMHDMLVETLGAVIYVIIFLVDKEKHPIIKTFKESKHNYEENEGQFDAENNGESVSA